MYVYNDATLDSRVRREAGSLASAGYEVTVMATGRGGATDIEREAVGGYEIVRVPVPTAWQRHWPAVVRPGVARGQAAARAGRALRGGPRCWPDAMRQAAVVLMLLGLAVLRRLVMAIPRWLGGPGEWPSPDLYWLVTWRRSILGWADAATAVSPVSSVHHGHDLTGLPAALRGARRDGSTAVYDSHEIFLDSGSNPGRPRWARAMLRILERRWAARTAALVTVNPAYAEVIARRVRPARKVVVHNCPPRWTPEPGAATRLAAAAGVPGAAQIVLYHGAFSRYRGMEELSEAMLEPGLERAHLVFLGYGGQRAALEALAAQPRFGGRLHVIDAVPPDELLGMIAGADVDAIPLQRSTLNHWLCTPNKLFESLAAGTPVVVSDFPVMRRIVLDDPDGPLGEVCDPASPASIAAAIRSILDRPDDEKRALRDRCRAAAGARWNWETESKPLLDLYESLVPSGGTIADSALVDASQPTTAPPPGG